MPYDFAAQAHFGVLTLVARFEASAKVMDGATIRVPLCLQAFVEMSQDEYA